MGDTCSALESPSKPKSQSSIDYLSHQPIYLSSISILEHKNRKILEQLEEQKKRLRMQAQGPGTAAAGTSRFVGKLFHCRSSATLWFVNTLVSSQIEQYICYITS